MSEDPNRIDDEEVDRLLESQRRERIVRQRNVVLIVAGVALLALVLAALIVWRVRSSKTEAEAEVEPTVSVKVAKAEKGTIAAPITAVGTIWPREKADISAKVSAQIKSMALLKNKVVRAGQIIAVLESRDLQAQRADAPARCGRARCGRAASDPAGARSLAGCSRAGAPAPGDGRCADTSRARLRRGRRRGRDARVRAAIFRRAP